MRKVMGILLACLMILFTSSTFVFAKEALIKDETLDFAEKMDSRIFDEISAAQNKAQSLIDCYNKEINNLQKSSINNETVKTQILILTDKLNTDIDTLVSNLIDKTNAEAHGVVLKAAETGVEVTSEYIPVEIGGRIVLVDPQRVMGI